MKKEPKQKTREIDNEEFEILKEYYTKTIDLDHELLISYPRAIYRLDKNTMALVSPNRDEKYNFQRQFVWKNQEFFIFTFADNDTEENNV